MIDVVDIKVLCREGKFEAFVEGDRIYLRDTENGDTVTIGYLPQDHLEEHAPIPQEPMNNIDFLKELGKFFVQMGREYEASAFAVGVVEEMEEKGIEVDYEKLQ